MEKCYIREKTKNNQRAVKVQIGYVTNDEVPKEILIHDALKQYNSIYQEEEELESNLDKNSSKALSKQSSYHSKTSGIKLPVVTSL